MVIWGWVACVGIFGKTGLLDYFSPRLVNFLRILQDHMVWGSFSFVRHNKCKFLHYFFSSCSDHGKYMAVGKY